MTDQGQRTVIVGAGPVGALAALYAASRGDQVSIYELRGDLRDPSVTPLNFTRSINIAIAERGVNSLRHANCPGLLESVLADTIPMRARMIHGELHGQLFEQSQPYDVHGRFNRGADRTELNKRMLDQLEKMPNVQIFFNHKLVGADFKRRVAWFEKRHPPSQTPSPNAAGLPSDPDVKDEIEVTFDFMIGADGAHSSVRYHLMKYTRMNYQQEYIDTLWCQFQITPAEVPGPHGNFKMSKNHLHIWPAGEFMFIAIASPDDTFVCTLFLPAARYAELDARPDSIIPFFQKHFPGVVPNLISEEEIQRQYQTSPHLPLISIKCTPYHFSSSVVIVGDAAHAMVPFYGQGMNAGFEDVRVLFEIMDKHSSASASVDEQRVARGEALAAYTLQRSPDAHAINDLALRNYQEMRSDVRSPIYRLRKYVEETLYKNFPSLGFATQYSRVSFGNQRYSEVVKLARKQGIILSTAFASTLAGLFLTLVIWYKRNERVLGNNGFGNVFAWFSLLNERLKNMVKKGN